MILKAVIIIKNFIRKSLCLDINQIYLNKNLKTQKRRKERRTKRSRRKVAQNNVTPDIVVVDMLFGEQIKADN